MESAQRELVNVLLKLIFSQGLISRTTYSEAINLVYSVMDFSELLRYPVCLSLIHILLSFRKPLGKATKSGAMK